MRPTAVERFIAKVDTSAGLFGCWPWTGAIDPKGYGRFRGPDGHTTSASRFALQLKLGRPLGPDEQARHVVCDNPPCCNPAHLEPGTNADNMADMVAHERHFSRTKPERLARGDRHGSRLHPERRALGERNGLARLDSTTVRAIRERRAQGETLEVIAGDYGVSTSAVSRVALGRTWRHVA